MSKLLTIPFLILFISCGVENVNKINTAIDSSEEVSISETSPAQELTDSSPYYNDVVANNEQESESDQETNPNQTEQPTTDQSSTFVEFTGVLYLSKTGTYKFINSNGIEYKMDELSQGAQNTLNQITFPNDSYEVLIRGSRILSSLKSQTAYTNNNFNISPTPIVTSYYFYLDEIELNEQAGNPEREINDELFSSQVCGDILIDPYSSNESIIIRNSDSSYLLSIPKYDYNNPSLYSSRMTKYLNLKNYLSTNNNVTKGCIYSDEAIFRDYSITWRQQIYADAYDVNW